jgi:alpha-tubulin suppressor-like RCC1 family protein
VFLVSKFRRIEALVLCLVVVAMMVAGCRKEEPSDVASPGLKVLAVAAGSKHSLAVAGDGTVWAWGYNSSGQLGDGTTTNRSTPVQVQGMADVAAIAGGYEHTIAFRPDGTVWVWGWNDWGQLGDGTRDDRSTPAQVQGMADVVAVAGGMYHTLALLGDGTVWAWG